MVRPSLVTHSLRFLKLFAAISVGWAGVAGASPVSATGGVETTTEAGSYRVHTFYESGTLEVQAGGEVEYLVVAGGGGGGAYIGGGGGAGGLLTGTVGLKPGRYAIQVGEGGQPGANGEGSSFAKIEAAGGGHGGFRSKEGALVGTGGSGGGGTFGEENTPGNGLSTPTPQGAEGGAGHPGTTGAGRRGGGGGGYSSAGAPAQLSDGGGNGGSGFDSAAFRGLEQPTRIAGGGGGGASEGRPAGRGTDGGGDGANDALAVDETSLSPAADGQPNTGGGGGGGGFTGAGRGGSNLSGPGGSGGSGLVVIRYPLSVP